MLAEILMRTVSPPHVSVYVLVCAGGSYCGWVRGCASWNAKAVSV